MKPSQEKDVSYEGVATDEPVDDGLQAALDKIGDYSAWLWIVFILLSLPGVFNIWALTSFVFLAYEPPYWCDVPELRGLNWSEQVIRNITTGSVEGSSCTAPKYNYTALAALSPEEAELEAREWKKTISSSFKCEEFSYVKPETSIVSEWDLICDNLKGRSDLQMVVALGKFVGAFLFGILADKWGRKTVVVISCTMYIVGGPVGAIRNRIVLTISRFILGVAGAGCYNCAFTLLTEVTNPKRRTLLGILYNMSYPVGLVILPVIAFYVQEWQKLQLALTIPAVILIVTCCVIPESPRWLISQGRRDDAWKVVKRANKELAKSRNTTVMLDEQQTANVQEEKVPWKKRFADSTKKLLSLMSYGDLCLRLLISMFMWWVNAFAYFTLSLNADNFTTDRYIYTGVSGLVEALSYIIPIPVLHYVGRRHTSAVMYFLCGISLLAILAIPVDQPMVILTVAMIGRLCISAVYSVFVLYTSELFPTVNRNTAVGLSSTMSHVGAIVAPYIVVQLGAVGRNIPSTICGLVSIAAGLLVLLLPETKGKVLCDTVEEMKENNLKGDKVTIKNCCSLH